MPLKASFGAADESTYGTPVTVDHFFEIVRESIRATPGRIQAAGLNAGARAPRSDRFVPIPTMGASGDVELEVHSKGFGFWLKHMLGKVETGSVGADGEYDHTGTVDTLYGDSFTAQVNRPYAPSETNKQFTYHGGKVTSWRLANAVNGLLVCTLSCDFEDVDETTALATVSYPSSTELFSWAGGSVEIADSSFPVTSFEVTCNNQLKVDRRFLRSSALKKEPTEQAWRDISWTLEAEFENDTQLDRVMSATAAGAVAKIEGTWASLTAIGGTTFPSLGVTIPAARFDGEPPVVDGPGPITLRLTGKGLYDGTNSPITTVYTSADSAP